MKLPLSSTKDHDYGWDVAELIVDADGISVASTFDRLYSDPDSAAEIVRRVNAHDALVAALERVGKTNLYGVLCFCGSIWSAHSDACDQANAALKLAQEARP